MAITGTVELTGKTLSLIKVFCSKGTRTIFGAKLLYFFFTYLTIFSLFESSIADPDLHVSAAFW